MIIFHCVIVILVVAFALDDYCIGSSLDGVIILSWI